MIRLVTLLLLFIAANISAQSIKGQIFIDGTNNPLPNASIYYDGMYRGGISDENGNFQIASLGTVKTPILVSAIGYHSVSIENYSIDSFLTIYLHPKVYNLDMVVVTFDGMTREEKEAIFKHEFIGSSQNASQCEILNMDDIDLVYNRKLSTLEAFSSVPIRLNNKALGFKITYYLDKFQSSNGSVFFAGNYFFEPSITLKGKELKRIEQQREHTYLGSRMHFIRAIYNNRLDSDGYKILNGLNERVEYSSFVSDNEKEKTLKTSLPLKVIYKGAYRRPTFLEILKDSTIIEKSGFYDPAGVTWAGKMAGDRMGDLLPFEYDLDERK